MKDKDVASKPLKKLIEEQQMKHAEQNRAKANLNENKQKKNTEVHSNIINKPVAKNVNYITSSLNAMMPQSKVN
jgi:hypothetical protein